MNTKFLRRRSLALTLFTSAVGIAACAGDSIVNPDAAHPVALAIATRPASSISAMMLPGGPSMDVSTTAEGALVVHSGDNVLEFDSVNVVFARVVLYKGTQSACGDDDHDDAADAACAELKSGPILVSLPLTAGAKSLFSVPAPTGTYAGMKLRVQNPSTGSSGASLQTFIAEHPAYANKSIRVVGKFNGEPFVWTGDPSAQMEQVFDPVLEVADDKGLSLTLKVDVTTWFQNDAGALMDPRATYYPQIAENIRRSFRMFEDKDLHADDDHEGQATQP